MKLINFINEVLSSAVDALSECSKGNEEEARERMFSIATKILNRMPATKKQPAPWPGRGQT